MEDGNHIDFDYLVIASGSSFISWPYLKSRETGMDARQAEVEIEGAALEKADLTAKNIRRLVDNPNAKLKSYKPSKTMSFIPIGKKQGAVQLPFGHAHFMISIKQKDLFVSKTLNP